MAGTDFAMFGFMTDLQRLNLSAISAARPYWAAAGLACGAAMMWAARVPFANPPAAVVAGARSASAAAPRSVSIPDAPQVAVEVAPPALAESVPALHFIVELDGTGYLRLADLGREGAAVNHASLQLRERDNVWFSYASVAAADMPSGLRGWLGTSIIADGGCRATVTGFAVIARLVGSPEYAGSGDSEWSAASGFEQGARILAARLDGCADRNLARAEAASAIIEPRPLRDGRLAAAARRALLASAPAAAAQLAWSEAGGAGDWRTQATFEQRVLRHPGTGVTWVIQFAHIDASDCGSPDVRLLGMWRADRSGNLVEVSITALDEFYRLDRIIDSDGDGQFELLGKDWLGLDWILIRGDGSEVDRMSLPFYGCPC